MEHRVDFLVPDLRGEAAARLRGLAGFVATGLAERGLVVDRVVPEPWGWAVEMANDEFPLWVACGASLAVRGGYACRVEPSLPLVRRGWRKYATAPAVRPVLLALRDLLATSADVHDVRWSTGRVA